TYAGESFAWSPDSKMIAFVSASDEPDQDFIGNSSKSDDPRVVDRIQYKSRTSLADRLRTHLWIVNAEKTYNELRQLTSGPYYDGEWRQPARVNSELGPARALSAMAI